MNFVELLDGVFNEGTEEFDTLKETHDLIVQSSPIISAEAKTHLLLLDHSRVKLVTMYYSLSKRIASLNDQFQATHDAAYTRLVKIGRPSKDAIEAEIRATNPEYAGISRQIIKYENIKELVSMYIRCIDASKTTTIELLKNMYRLD